MIWTCNVIICSTAFVVSAIMFGSTLAVGEKKWTRETYPNPYLHPRNCSRETQSYVCDPDEILEEGQADQLDAIIMRIKNETACLCEVCSSPQGVIIAVALMKTMSNISDSFINDDDAEAFASYLRHHWNFGQCDDDVVLLISSVDQKFFASVGFTVTTALDKNIALRIFQVNRDHFTTGYYYQGLESIMESYYYVLRQHNANHYGDEHTKPSSPQNKDITVALTVSVLTLVALSVFITIIIYRIRRTSQKTEDTEVGNSLSRWHASKNKKSSPGDYERCSEDDHCDDDNSSEGSSVLSETDSEILSDAYQMNRIYNISKRQLSAVPEESENEDDEYDNEERDENDKRRTSSISRKFSANGVPQISQLQNGTEE